MDGWMIDAIKKRGRAYFGLTVLEMSVHSHLTFPVTPAAAPSTQSTESLLPRAATLLTSSVLYSHGVELGSEAMSGTHLRNWACLSIPTSLILFLIWKSTTYDGNSGLL